MSNRLEGWEDTDEIIELMQNMVLSRAVIVAENKPRGSVECPKCKGELSYTVSSFNGHVWAQCETENCLQWME